MELILPRPTMIPNLLHISVPDRFLTHFYVRYDIIRDRESFLEETVVGIFLIIFFPVIKSGFWSASVDFVFQQRLLQSLVKSVDILSFSF